MATPSTTSKAPPKLGLETKNSPLAGLPSALVMLMSIVTSDIAPVPSLLVIVRVPLKAVCVSVAD